MWSTILAILLIVTATVLIFLVLIQRGRGGGLAGAFGGLGGQSAFGTKAGDLFTRITIGVATFWIILCIVTIKVMANKSDQFDPNLGRSANAPVTPGPSSTGAAGAAKGTPSDSGAKDSDEGGGAKSSGDAKSGGETTSSDGSSRGADTSSAPAGAEKSESSK